MTKFIAERQFQVKHTGAGQRFAHQTRASRKKSKFTEDTQLLAADAIEDEEVAKMWRPIYSTRSPNVSALRTRVVPPFAGAPKDDKYGADAPLYVVVPFNVVLAHYARAMHRTELLPPRKMGAWLVKTDLAVSTSSAPATHNSRS